MINLQFLPTLSCRLKHLKESKHYNFFPEFLVTAVRQRAVGRTVSRSPRGNEAVRSAALGLTIMRTLDTSCRFWSPYPESITKMVVLHLCQGWVLSFIWGRIGLGWKCI